MFATASYFIEDHWKKILIALFVAILFIVIAINISAINIVLGLDRNLSGLEIGSVTVIDDEIASAVLLQELVQKGAQLDTINGAIVTGRLTRNNQGAWVLAVNTNDNVSVVAETPWFMGDMFVYTSKIDTLEVLSSDVAEKLTTFYHRKNVKKED